MLDYLKNNLEGESSDDIFLNMKKQSNVQILLTFVVLRK